MNAKSKPPQTTTSTTSSSARLRLESDEILRGNTTIEIEHAGQRYLLRVTRENKLILTK